MSSQARLAAMHNMMCIAQYSSPDCEISLVFVFCAERRWHAGASDQYVMGIDCANHRQSGAALGKKGGRSYVERPKSREETPMKGYDMRPNHKHMPHLLYESDCSIVQGSTPACCG